MAFLRIIAGIRTSCVSVRFNLYVASWKAFPSADENLLQPVPFWLLLQLVNSGRDAYRAAFFCNLRGRSKNQLDLGLAGVVAGPAAPLKVSRRLCNLLAFNSGLQAYTQKLEYLDSILVKKAPAMDKTSLFQSTNAETLYSYWKEHCRAAVQTWSFEIPKNFEASYAML